MSRPPSSSSSWQRQRGEPARAHALFSSYLALGPGRSLPSLARSGLASLSHLRKLSARWQWRERAASWQAQLAAAGRSAQPDSPTSIRERQLRDALAMQQLAKAQISLWLKRDHEGTLQLIKQLTPHQVMRFWQVGFLVEDGLLPAPAPEAREEMRLALLRQQREREAPSPPPERALSLPRAFAAFEEALRAAGMGAAARRRLLSLVRRWLWLPEEDGKAIPLSLSSRKMAKTSLKARKKGTVPHEG
jgi:hypothetical protein